MMHEPDGMKPSPSLNLAVHPGDNSLLKTLMKYEQVRL